MSKLGAVSLWVVVGGIGVAGASLSVDPARYEERGEDSGGAGSDETKGAPAPLPKHVAAIARAVLGPIRVVCEDQISNYANPSRTKALPPVPEGSPPGRTLVLDLDDVLVHTTWDRSRGHRTFKRPAVEAFIARAAELFEIVIFTSSTQVYADPIVERLDTDPRTGLRRGHIHHILYRDATRYRWVGGRGVHSRDLSCLNRQEKNVLYITHDENVRTAELQPNNYLVVPRFKGDTDSSLADLLPFLEWLATQSSLDVRDVMKTFKDRGDVVPEFSRRMAQFQANQRPSRAR